MSDHNSDLASIFSQKYHLPDDTVFYSIFPDFSLTSGTGSTTADLLHNLHLQILQTITLYTDPYIFQHEPFTISVAPSPIPHLAGHLRFGDNLEDEWFVAFLLFTVSQRFPNLSIAIHDSDGQFLLIETAFHLPGWVNPDTSTNRVFLRRGRLYILPPTHLPGTPSLTAALKFLSENDNNPDVIRATPDSVQAHLEQKFNEYPEKAERNMHKVRVRVPVRVAWVLKNEPCLISLAVEGFYDRDVDSMKFADRMEVFLPNGKEEELVQVFVKMSRTMYAQLMQQTFRPPKRYPAMPLSSDLEGYKEAELGMKIACGFEMMYQMRKRQGEEGKGSNWDVFRENLEKCGYFDGLLPGSAEYKRRMEKAEEYYKNSISHHRASEMINAPVRRIDEILSLPHSLDDFKGGELPPSDDDSWLYYGEKELDAALEERQKEMESFDSKRKLKQKAKEEVDAGPSDYDLGEIANSMQEFVQKMSSYEGAEVPGKRGMKDVDFDVDSFMKDLQSVMRHPGFEGRANDSDLQEGSSDDMDFDDSDDDSNMSEPAEDNEERGGTFMESYSDVLNKELKATTLGQSFVRPDEGPLKKDEGTSKASEDMQEEFKPVDVDFNLVKNLLESFSSQQGLPGPASNLLGLMGLQLPEDGKKGK
ncbi:OLC1v1011664C1 [Oldenlandia corymbosa var. corymbosa]|uniref:OLC1v1011664C1 n=1 Tax=Oldenlandia corymbosa var. corymbosa TaxID=529605 RepID=A0AAV1DU44_OLDCO|nr:OLC1v1011664C1 [Oldenlandia corymbosa var. corymbosa]